MRKVFFAAFLIAACSCTINAQTQTPVVDKREQNQKERIKDGVKSGELTKPEAKKLRKQQHHIENVENKAEADGTVTAAERAKLDRKQDRASKRIAKQKHDKQDRH